MYIKRKYGAYLNLKQGTRKIVITVNPRAQVQYPGFENVRSAT